MMKYFGLLLTVLLLSGCFASGGGVAPVEDRTGHSNYGNTVVDSPDDGSDTTVEAKPYVAPPAPRVTVQATTDSRPPKSNAAVLSLVSIADNSIKHGDYVAASAALERALRHDAKNADLWHRLAQVRLRQRQNGQAESLALKSNALADGNKSLMSKNWTLISKSRRLRGDSVGADEAEVRAYQLIK